MTYGVQDSIFAQYVDAVRVAYVASETTVDVKSESWQIGALRSRGKSSLPLVSFRRDSGQLEPGARRNPQTYADEGVTYSFETHYDDVATVLVKLVATDWRQLDCLHSGIVYAVRTALGVEAQPGSYQHLTEDDGEPLALAQAGHQVLVQSFTWRIPVPHVWGVPSVVTTVAGASEIQPADGVEPYTAGNSSTQT